MSANEMNPVRSFRSRTLHYASMARYNPVSGRERGLHCIAILLVFIPAQIKMRLDPVLVRFRR